MKIPMGEYNLQSFLEYVTDHTGELFAREERKWLKVYLIFVQVDWMKLFKEFKPEKFGDFVHVPMGTEGSTIDFYAYEYAPGLLMFFTSSTEENYERSLKRFIDSTRGITEMWIPPARFEEAKAHILSKYNGEIYKFIGRRTAITKIPARRRPEYQRRISYSGLDAHETLKEVKEMYGVLPISIEFVVGQDKFKITDDGLFVLRTINPRTLQIMLDVVNIILGKQLHFEKVTKGVSANVELVQIGEKEFRIPEIVAAKIVLKTQALNAVLVERIFGEREDIVEDDVLPAQRPWSDEFSFVDKTILEGSLSFSGTVIDEYKGTIFGLSGGENEILLIPKHHTTFESFVRFYRMIVEKIDDEAELSLLSEEVV
ncbi:MAG: hypothetical protein ABSF09_10485 [Candidatus Bathyarchaeia archaeon]|jgi:hypothetical protein